MFAQVHEVQGDSLLSRRTGRTVAQVEQRLAVGRQAGSAVVAWEMSSVVRELDGEGMFLDIICQAVYRPALISE